MPGLRARCCRRRRRSRRARSPTSRPRRGGRPTRRQRRPSGPRGTRASVCRPSRNDRRLRPGSHRPDGMKEAREPDARLDVGALSLQVRRPSMTSVLAIGAAFLFAVAATLQQKGALALAVAPDSFKSFARLAGQRWWLAGSAALLVGYLLQAIALDRGRLSIIQPLLVTTVVFALPLGYWLTDQAVSSREVVGAMVVVCGLASFAIVGDPAGGKENAPNDEWAIALLVITLVCAAFLVVGRGGTPATQATTYGIVAGILFGASACLVKPTTEFLHDGVSEVLSHWELYAMAIAGVLAFVLHQVSLSGGFLTKAFASVSVANPLVSVLIGSLLFDERLQRPLGRVLLAEAGLVVAMIGAIVISSSSEPTAETAQPGLVPAG